jgi:hypothetical protein
MSTQVVFRTQVLAGLGARSDVIDELLAYDPHGLGDGTIPPDRTFPLDDEPFVETWRLYAREAATSGLQSLADRLVQLSFPVEAGISDTDEYRSATRAGTPRSCPSSGGGLTLVRPEECIVLVHSTWAGAIPVIRTGCREDFVSLVRAFTARNEPVPVPLSQGASIVAGYNNWHRVRQLRERWTIAHPGASFSLRGIAEFKEQYQDRFIILSDGWYSGVPPSPLGLTEPEWRQLSLTIRLEHECAHYWTKRVHASMRNCVLDEIIADCCGIVAACGQVRADWLLLFLGLESDGLAENGRLHNYRGRPRLSDAAFAIVQRLVRNAAAELDTFGRRYGEELSGQRGLLLILLTLSGLTLEQIASGDAQVLLREALTRARQRAGARRDDVLDHNKRTIHA